MKKSYVICILFVSAFNDGMKIFQWIALPGMMVFCFFFSFVNKLAVIFQSTWLVFEIYSGNISQIITYWIYKVSPILETAQWDPVLPPARLDHIRA